MTHIIRVAVPTPLRRCFDYQVGSDTPMAPGMRVRVPFGKRILVGMVVETQVTSDLSMELIKPIEAVIDAAPLLPASLLDLAFWVSDYYHHALGEVLLGTMPRLLRLGRPVLVDKEEQDPEQTPCSGPLALNTDQQCAVDKVTAQSGFSVFLLEGVTGSGKTEVYLQIIAQVLQRHQQALVLIPEIALTPQTIARFASRFSVPMALLHSGLTDKQRLSAWLRARSGQARIIIGTRSAVFTPLPDLGVVILDEEHDPSFKQQSGLRYSARDVGVVRAKQLGIPIVLGSATPAFESLYNAYQGRYQHLLLPKRAGDAKPPTFQLIDMRGKKMRQGLSQVLLDAISATLLNKEQVLLFLNRRGYAPVMLCHQCGWYAECTHCDAKLTLHQASNQLRCHHCQSVYTVPKQCLHCHSHELMHIGLGTEQLEQVLKKYFPGIGLARFDSDTTRKKGSLQALLNQVHTGESQLIIGTQMLGKGHHFSEVTLVVVVDADCGLLSTDFRATEHLSQLLLQVSGRAGREKKPGTVLIQTHHPNHPFLQCLLQSGYTAFAQTALSERREARLPPFSHLALLRAESKRLDQVTEFLQTLYDQIKSQMSEQSLVHLYPPVPASMEKRLGRYRAQLLFQSGQRSALHALLVQVLARIDAMKLHASLRWSLDVDPIDVS